MKQDNSTSLNGKHIETTRDLNYTTQYVTDNFTNVTSVLPTQQLNTFLSYRVCLIIIGLLGLLANGIVLTSMTSKSIRTKSTNILIIDQLATDGIASLMLMVDSSLAIAHPVLEDNPLWLGICLLFASDTLMFIALTHSVGNLVLLTLERYIKIVCPILHREYFRKWMVKMAIGLSLLYSIGINTAAFPTTEIKDGACAFYTVWSTEESRAAYFSVWIIFSFFLPLTLLIYFYSHILIKVRRTWNTVNFIVAQRSSPALQISGQLAPPGGNLASKNERNILRTLILVTLVFITCWLMAQIYFFLYVILTINLGNNIYYISIIILYSGLTVNPFIYATNLTPLRRKFKRILTRTTIIPSPINPQIPAN